MFFNSQLLCSLVLVSAALLAGCDVKVGEQPPPSRVEQFNGTKCLTAVLPYISRFAEGNGTDDEIRQTWDCFGTAVDKFRKYVRGSSSDRYTPQELATFLQDNFLENTSGRSHVISQQLQLEIMKIKQIFVGGSRDALTMGELEGVMSIFGSFKELALGVNPYMKVFALSWTPTSERNNVDKDYFENANKAIQVFANGITSLVQRNHQGYVLADVVVLMKEIGTLSDTPWSGVSEIEKFMPVVQKIKKAVAGGLEGTVASHEWKSFLSLSARGYVQFLRYHYFLSKSPQDSNTYRLNVISRSIEDGFSVFQDLVLEKPGGVVTRDEITEIADALMKAWPSFKSSDRLLLEIMKIKQVILGGSLDSFSSSDFANAGVKLAVLRPLVEKSLPYFAVYGQEWDPKTAGTSQQPLSAEQFFQQAQENLAAVAAGLGNFFESSYDLANIEILVRELTSLYPKLNSGRDEPLQDVVKKYLPVLTDFKNMVYEQKDSLLKKAQWPSILKVTASAYSVFLYEEYFFEDFDLDSVVGLSRVNNFVTRVIVALVDMIKLNPSAKFSQERMNSLVKRLIAVDLISDKYAYEIFRRGIDIVLNRVLVSPDRRLDGNRPSGLNLASLEIFNFEFQVWMQQELFIRTIFKQDEDTYSPGYVQRAFAAKYRVPGLSKELNTGLVEMIMALDSPVPMTLSSAGYQVISSWVSQDYSRKAVSQLNTDRLITRVLTRSYAGSMKRISNYTGINLEEAQNAFKEVKPIAVSLGLVAEDSNDFADSRFREASIFVPSADGDEYMSFREGVQLVSMVTSGVKLNKVLTKDVIRGCLGSSSRPNDDTLVSVACVAESYRYQLPRLLKRILPEQVSYIGAVDPAIWGGYMANVLKTAGYVANSTQSARLRDIRLAPHVIQYIEILFVKFDKNRNFILDTDESMLAFPIFRALIKKFSAGSVADADLDSVFSYILKFGKPPETTNDKLYFVLRWKGKRESWNLQVDRTMLANILGYIADQTALPK